MTSIPDTATTVVRASHVPGPPQGEWTYEAYAALPDPEGYRYEVIDGVLYMSPSPNTEHENIAALVIGRFVVAIEDTGLGRVMVSPDIHVGPSVLRPDAVVVLEKNRGAIARAKLIGPPDLVVEIASPSTAAFDRDALEGKRGAYGRMGIREYWLIDPKARTVEVLTLEGEAYVTLGVFGGEQAVGSRVLPGPGVTARQLFPRE